MRKTMICILAVLLSTAVVHIAYGAMTCYNSAGDCLVHDGMDKSELLACCGSPDMQSSNLKVTHNGGTEETVNVDSWTYNCGTDRFMKKVIMENDKIMSIQSL